MGCCVWLGVGGNATYSTFEWYTAEAVQRCSIQTRSNQCAAHHCTVHITSFANLPAFVSHVISLCFACGDRSMTLTRFPCACTRCCTAPMNRSSALPQRRLPPLPPPPAPSCHGTRWCLARKSLVRCVPRAAPTHSACLTRRSSTAVMCSATFKRCTKHWVHHCQKAGPIVHRCRLPHSLRRFGCGSILICAVAGVLKRLCPCACVCSLCNR